jgi:hypothetical protein
MTWLDAGNAAVWLLAYIGVFAVLALATGQILRQHSRKIYENREKIEKISKKLNSAPSCFGGGDVLTPSGQAENGCPTCPYLNGCINTSERLRKVK